MMEQLIKAELTRFSRVFLSYTKIVIGGMVILLLGSILWSGLSLISQEAQVIVGVLLLFLVLTLVITRLIPLPIPNKTTDEKDWILREFGITSRDAAELGSVGAFIFALKNAPHRSQNQPLLESSDFPLRIQITKKGNEVVDDRLTEAFVMSEQEFDVFLGDIKQLLKVWFSQNKSDTKLPRQRIRPIVRPRMLQAFHFEILSAFVELPGRLWESAPLRHRLILLKETNIKSDLCRWNIETGSATVEEIELTVGYQGNYQEVKT